MRHLSSPKFEDPRGIAWRITNQMRGFDLRRMSRFVAGYLRNVRHERPVFILGAPRSGTTMLFRLLSQSPDLGSLPWEGHDMWRMYHHPRYSSWRSDSVGPGQVRFAEERFINAFLHAYFDQSRFVEKTPENSLRIPYLLDLFPDAHFLIIKRNPCDVVSSLINGWRDDEGRYRSYYVPDDLNIPGHPHRHQWRFVLIDGWRDFTGAPIPEIAFEQWRQCVKGIHDGRKRVSDSRWTEIHLEALLERPQDCIRRILDAVDVPLNSSMLDSLGDLVTRPVNALSAPRPDKWRHENKAAIEALLPRMAPLAKASGYLLDLETGDCRVATT